jgi:hypothetical protein
MATLNKEQIERALTRLGELAEAKGLIVELVAVGGAVMVLEFEARDATQDVDVVIAAPPNAKLVREIAATVAADLGLSSDWLNDAAKGYVGVPSHGPLIFNARGITVRRTSLEQMLAMKVRPAVYARVSTLA